MHSIRKSTHASKAIVRVLKLQRYLGGNVTRNTINDVMLKIWRGWLGKGLRHFQKYFSYIVKNMEFVIKIL